MLTTLDLQRNLIGYQGAQYFIDALKINTVYLFFFISLCDYELTIHLEPPISETATQYESSMRSYIDHPWKSAFGSNLSVLFIIFS